jgi:hypothetical protein
MWYLVPQPFVTGVNRPYPDFRDVTDDPQYPRVYDPVSSSRAFRRVGGWSQSLYGRQNRYSYATVGTTARFGGEVIVLTPPWP